MAKKRSSSEHIDLANSIDLWAKKYGVNNDPYVLQLVTNLRTRKNLTFLASLNHFDLLPNPELQSTKNLEDLNRMLAVARNMLVFLPVAITWFAVSKATSAFSLYTSKNSVSVVNFLEFWQNGYGVLAKEWTIGRVALVDFLLIVLVILLTLVTSYLGNKNQINRQKEIDKIDAERTSIAIDISSYLFDKQTVTPLSMNQNLATALSKLLNATESLDKSTSILEKKFKELPTHRDLLTEIKKIKSEIIKRKS
jgi:hypothetical protein